MSGLNYLLIVGILAVLMFKNKTRQFPGKDSIHLDSYICSLDKPTTYLSAAISALVWIAILLNIVKSFLNNLHNCSVSQIHYYIIQQFVGGNVAMIIRFQLGIV